MATLNPNLRDFWQDPETKRLRKARNRVLYGGRASSKSWEFAGRAAQIGQAYKTRFLCVRRYQNKIKDSVYTLIKKQIDNFKFSGYDVLASEIKHANGTDFNFYGIERNADEIKSFEGADVLWIEEAHNLTAEQWEILEPTIRKEGSEVWISFNPRLMTDFVYQRFIVNPPPNTITRLINYNENGFLSKTMLEIIENAKQEDFEAYEHIYLGVPRSDDHGVIIRRSWIEAAVDAHLKLDLDLFGARTVGYDVADGGEGDNDKNAAVPFNGAVCVGIDEWKAKEDELVESALRAWSHVHNGTLLYDSIGVGAHTGSTLKNNGVAEDRYFKFNYGGGIIKPDDEYSPGITNKEKFENLKAQAWRDVADRFYHTYRAVEKGETVDKSKLISISSEVPYLEALKTELSLQKWEFSKRGLDMVESKKALMKRGFKSPNKADAFIMGACPHLIERPALGFFDVEW
jgi:phage terminase large subunit